MRLIDNENLHPVLQKRGYEVVKPLGKGSFGHAWVARRGPGSGFVAVKEIDLRRVRDVRYVYNEVEILEHLDHLNVIRYVEAFEVSPKMYLVMEHAKGGDLSDRIAWHQQKREGFPENQILDWTIQLAMALRYVHSAGVIHRDVKTANVFVTPDNVIKLGDFGFATHTSAEWTVRKTNRRSPCTADGTLSRSASFSQRSPDSSVDDQPCSAASGSSKSKAGSEEPAAPPAAETKQQPALAICGSPYYMAPELHEAQRRHALAGAGGVAYTSKVDMWSFGVLLFELLTLTRPFDAKSKGSLRRRVVGRRFSVDLFSERYQGFGRGYSGGLKKVCASLLESDPAGRWSADDVLTCEHVQGELPNRASELRDRIQAAAPQAANAGVLPSEACVLAAAPLGRPDGGLSLLRKNGATLVFPHAN